MEQVKQVILDCLPSSAKNLLEKVLERVEDKGVDCIEDLKYIKFDEDFKDILKDVPARKLKEKMDIFFSGNSQLTQSDNSLKVNSSRDAESPVPADMFNNINTFLEGYKTPLIKFSRVIATKLKNNKRLTGREYRDIVRIIVSDVMDIETKPIKRHLEVIAQKVVQEYPIMLDKLEDKLIGPGYEGLLRKLISRIENVSRPSANSLKRKVKTTVTENFSCPNFLPNIDIDEKSLLQKKEALKLEFMSKSDWKPEVIKELMNETFPLQRLFISDKTSIKDLKSEWPFLFISITMIGHFNQLMEKDVLTEYENVFLRKMPEIYSYMETTNLTQKITLNKNYMNFLEVLCSYFEEDITQILNIFLKDECISDVKEKDVPVTPFIAVFGSPSEEESNCVLIIERTEASDFTTMKVASLLWFISFYIFNLEYPSGCPATAEFIQRACFGINPEKGTKSPKRCRRSRVNTKVQKFVEKLMNFKSMWNDSF